MGNPNRTIIIPKGTLNSDDVNVVVIPPTLQRSTLPLIVTTTTGNKLAARSLPIWGDELDPSSGLSMMEYDEPEAFEDVEDNNEIITTSICASPREDAPQILHMSSRTLSVSNEGPPESFEFSFDAPEGVDQNVFEAVVEKGASSTKRRRNFNRPSPVQDLDESDFNPPFNSTFIDSGGCSGGPGYSSGPAPVARRRERRSQPRGGCGPC